MHAERVSAGGVFLYVFKEHAATYTGQAVLRAAFKSRAEAVQIVTGDDKVLQKYAHHLDVRSFPRCTLK